MFLNLTKAPYNDPNFRSGISLALDRTTIAQKAVNGYTDAASLSGLILPNLQKDLDPSLPNKGLVTQDTSKAIAAFQKAGYTMQAGKLTKGGKQASIKIVMPNNFSDWIAAATEVKTELAKVGVAVSLDEPQYAQYEQQIGTGSFDAAMGGFGGSGSPYIDSTTHSTASTPLRSAPRQSITSSDSRARLWTRRSPAWQHATGQAPSNRPPTSSSRSVTSSSRSCCSTTAVVGAFLDEELHRVAVGQ